MKTLIRAVLIVALMFALLFLVLWMFSGIAVYPP